MITGCCINLIYKWSLTAQLNCLADFYLKQPSQNIRINGRHWIYEFGIIFIIHSILAPENSILFAWVVRLYPLFSLVTSAHISHFTESSGLVAFVHLPINKMHVDSIFIL